MKEDYTEEDYVDMDYADEEHGEEDYFGPEPEVDYYILDDDSLARVWYDAEAGEYVDGEVMEEGGQWRKFPVAEILADGEQLSHAEADELARSLGGTI